MINIDIIDLLFIALPEALVIFFMMNIFLEKKSDKKELLKISIIESIIYFMIMNLTPFGEMKLIVLSNYIFVYYMFYKMNFTYCFTAFALVLALKVFGESIVVMVLNTLGINLDYVFSIKVLKVCMSSCSSIIMLIIYLFIKDKDISLFNLSNKKIQISKKLKTISVIIGYLILLVCTVAVFYVKDTSDSYVDILVLFVIVICFISLSFLILSILALNKYKNLKEIESNLMSKNLSQMEDTVDLLRMQKHDYMNHLQIILMQVSKNNSEGAKNYIMGMINDDNIDNLYFNTGKDYIDAILNVKRNRAQKYNIELTACVDSLVEDTSLLEAEISAVILNIVDNAIDELKKHQDKEYRYIHVDMYDNEDSYYISIKNNGSKIDDTNKIFAMGYSSKGSNRGYGLYSIKNLLTNHNCELEVFSDDSETEFEIKIPMIKAS